MKKKPSLDKISYKLHRQIQQLRSLAHLIKNEQESDGCPHDYNEIREGIGLIMDSIAFKIGVQAERIDDILLIRAKKRSLKQEKI